ncbi:MAG: polyribonucleotide nucleotidyltransferase [Bacteroidetes bacterium HGW-Bacteroidetes-9]|jgi:polyribonucleotide nucleotidyltransferase|nr:MAG: polyribonucleotide nucleotidyltransferase [Bacteroidetes bacterium HGW-Bacteroidetes-9]
MNKEIKESICLSDNKEIIIETGLLAQLAHGSALVRCGNAMILATVVSNKEPKEGVDFLPLSVDYQEKYAANGKFPGGFLKREGRLSEHEILISRLVDRALRPLFPDAYNCETQVLISLISADENVMPDALACLAASTAIMLSDIVFNGPVAELRIARINNRWEINPSSVQLETADIELMVAGTIENIVMVEGEMKEVSEEEMAEAIRVAHEAIIKLCELQNNLVIKVGVKEKRSLAEVKEDLVLRDKLNEWCRPQIEKALTDQILSKEERKSTMDEVKKSFISNLKENTQELKPLIEKYFSALKKETLRNAIIKNGIRLDGRKSDEIRPISIRVNYLPSAHGSALFTRGETQSLTSVTLGNKKDEQMIDGVTMEGSNKFMLHYNFPPFSTGEAKPMRGTGRREVGHGNLAMRSLKQVLPSQEECPYTIRVVSDILQSNGSSSMATVCAGSLALMDAGVPLKRAVAGIAMGLIKEGENYAVLSDILGDEDHIGDMDFKLTGTEKGITGCQMDIKIEGLPYSILLKALNQAKAGREHILGCMSKVMPKPNNTYKPNVPQMIRFDIPKEFIGAVIGGGGKVIQGLQKETETSISIEEDGPIAHIEISGLGEDGLNKAKNFIIQLTVVPEVGVIYEGKVCGIMPFGAFVEILPGKQGLLHVSDIAWERVENVSDYVKEGDIIQVKVIEIDKKSGKMKLSRKALIEKPLEQ